MDKLQGLIEKITIADAADIPSIVGGQSQADCAEMLDTLCQQDATGFSVKKQEQLCALRAVFRVSAAFGETARTICAKMLWPGSATTSAQAHDYLNLCRPWLKLLETQNDPCALARLHLSQAIAHEYVSAKQSGDQLLDHLRQAREICSEVERQNLPAWLVTLARYIRANLLVDETRHISDETAQSNLAEAIGNYQNVIAAWKTPDMIDKRVLAMSNLSGAMATRARLNAGNAALQDLTKAAEIYREIIPLAAKIGESQLSAMTRLKLAHLMFDRAGRRTGAAQQADFTEALGHFDDLREIWAGPDTLEFLVKALVNKAVVQHARARTQTGQERSNDLTDAGLLCDEAIAKFEHPGTPGDLARAWSQRGNLYWSQSRLKEATAAFSDLESALWSHSQADAIWTETGNDNGRANTMMDSAIVFSTRAARKVGEAAIGDVDQALELLHMALEIKSDIGDRFGAAQVARNLATALTERADHVGGKRAHADLGSAIQFYKQAANPWSRTEDASVWAAIAAERAAAYWARSKLGNDASNQDDLETAIALFNEVEPILSLASDSYKIASLSYNFGLALAARADLDRQARQDETSALDQFDRALGLWNGPSDLLFAADVRLAKADLLVNRAQRTKGQSDLSIAVGLYSDVLDLHDPIVEPGKWVRAAEGKAFALYLQGADEAENALSVLLQTGVRLVFTLPDRASQEIVLRRLSGVGDRLAMLRLQADDLGAAIMAVSLGRGIRALLDGFLDQLHGSAGRLRDRVLNLRRRVQDMDQIRQDPAAESNIANAKYTAVLEELHTAQTKLENMLSADGHAFSFAPPDLKTLVAAMDDDMAMVIPLVTETGGAFIVISGATSKIETTWRALPALTPKALETLMFRSQGWTDTYNQAFQTGPGQLWNPADDTATAFMSSLEMLMSDLWDSLMGPLHNHLLQQGFTQDSTIIMVPPGRLAGAPLAAAWRQQDDQNRPFLADWIVCFSQSPTTWVSSRKQARDRLTSHPFLLAVSDPTEDLAVARVTRFENRQRQVVRIMGADTRPQIEPGWSNPAWPIFASEMRLELAGRDATVTRVSKAIEAATYAVFYCHGGWDRDHGRQSGLLMAAEAATPEALLADGTWPGELLNVDRLILEGANLSNLRAMILAACETAPVGLDLPDEFQGLGYGLALRVPAVLSTLFPVTPTMTTLLVRAVMTLHLARTENEIAERRPGFRNPIPLSAALAYVQRAAWQGGAAALDYIITWGTPHLQPAQLMATQSARAASQAITPIARAEVPMQRPRPGPLETLDIRATRHPFYWAALTLIGN